MGQGPLRSPEQLVESLRRHAEIITDYVRLAPNVSSVERLLDLACLQAARGIGISHAKIMRHRPDVGDLLIVAGIGWKPGVVGHAVFGTDLASPPGRALLTREAVLQDDAPNDTEFRYDAVLRDHGITSLLNAPISTDGVVWGVLEVDSPSLRHFGPDDSKFLLALGNVIGLALLGRMGLQRASEVEARTALALSRERTLLEELHHRSKNDLQLILTMLVVQKRKQTDAEVRRGYDHVMDQVAAIGVAHDQLAPGNGVATVELADYLQALCGSLERRREDIRIEVSLGRAEVSHDRAVPLGLILNELVTNALKHAFPDQRGGVIEVSFVVNAQDEGCLRVQDNGVGMGPPRSGSSGTELVQRLVQQLGGTLRSDDVESGSSHSISFPLIT